jgi:hypothetical protein
MNVWERTWWSRIARGRLGTFLVRIASDSRQGLARTLGASLELDLEAYKTRTVVCLAVS